MTASIFVQITVKDFNAWKKAYHDGEQLRKDNGVITDSVHRNSDNPSSVMVYNQFANEDALKSFLALMQSPPAQESLKAAGVQTSEIWFGEDV